jgi:hypothetical protein
MIMADVGDSIVVRGINMAIADEGPIPGNTPTRVPIIQPIKAQKRFPTPRAVEKP